MSNDVCSNTTYYDNLSTGSTDISVDPRFAHRGNAHYHLSVDSLCIDAGTGLA